MDEKLETANEIGRISLNRRTITRGIGWGVPAVMVLGATPAFAATNTPFDFTGLEPAVINAGNPTSSLTATGTGPNGATITVTLSSWEGTAQVTGGKWSITIPAANAPEGLNVLVGASSSAGGSATKTYTKDLTAPQDLAINATTGTNPSTVASNRKSGTLKGTRGIAQTPTADGVVTATATVAGGTFTFGDMVDTGGNTWSIAWTYLANSGNSGAPKNVTFGVAQHDGANNASTASRSM